MHNKRLITIIIGLVAFIIVVVVIVMKLNQSQQAKKQLVLVAQKNLMRGSYINPTAIQWHRFPLAKIKNDYVTRARLSKSDFNRAVLTRNIAAKSIIKKHDLAILDKHFSYSQILRKGMMATTIYVKMPANALIKRGDRADIIWIFNKNSNQRRRQYSTANTQTKTLASHVLVLATQSDSGQSRSGFSRSSSKTQWVLLETTADQNTLIQKATNLGKLSLVMSTEPATLKEPPMEKKLASQKIPGTEQKQSTPVVPPPPEPVDNSVTIIKGTSKEVINYD